MKITWNPSEKLLQKAKLATELKSNGLTNEKIASTLGVHITYIIALRNLYKDFKNE